MPATAAGPSSSNQGMTSRSASTEPNGRPVQRIAPEIVDVVAMASYYR